MTAFSPKFYQMTKHNTLLINKCVAGFYVGSFLWQSGLYAQEISVGEQTHFFVYKPFNIPTFFFFTRNKLAAYLDRLRDEFSRTLGVMPIEDFSEVDSLLQWKIRWVGTAEKATGDYSRIVTPSGDELIYVANGGKPTLIPACQVFLRPLGYIL